MDKEAFARVVKAKTKLHSTSDRLIVGDMPGNQWYEIPVDGCALVQRGNFDVDFELRFQAADEFEIPFYPEHVFWVSRLAGRGRLLLRVAVHRQSDDSVVVGLRHERNARTQMMRPMSFTADPALAEARDIAAFQRHQFVVGFDAYDVHLKALFREDWERIVKLRTEMEKAGGL